MLWVSAVSKIGQAGWPTLLNDTGCACEVWRADPAPFQAGYLMLCSGQQQPLGYWSQVGACRSGHVALLLSVPCVV